MKLNADIGELIGDDAIIVPYITMANIACGFHASDPQHMAETVKLVLSAKLNIQIGAHVSYRDRENFGRVSVSHTSDEISELVHLQVRALAEVCSLNSKQVNYIKPHGALYHDMMMNPSVRDAICAAAIELNLPLVVQAQVTSRVSWSKELAIITESFADRTYTDDGMLVSRNQTHAVHDTAEKIIAQAEQLMKSRGTSENGVSLHLNSDTICIHGDNAASVAAIKQIHALF